MPYGYFIASRYRNRDAVVALAAALRDRGKRVYCFPESSPLVAADADPEAAMLRFEATAAWRSDTGIRVVFERNLAALRSSLNVILLLPAGKSAHMEAGIAFGLGKRLILIGEQREAETLYLVFDEVYSDTRAFLASLA
jgi:hypothetical protein